MGKSMGRKEKAARRPHEIRVLGGEEEDRTPDLRIANAALSQLSYGPTMLPEQGADLTMTAHMRAIPRAAFFRMHVRCPRSRV